MTAFRSALASHIGGRDENQDAARLFVDPDAGAVLAVVADGMGGHKEGALAAHLAIEAATEIWARRGSSQPEEILQQVVTGAHERIRKAAKARGIDSRTVLAALWICPKRAISIHAGDCRVLQFGPHDAVKRTIDHSIAQLNVLKGKITEAEMATHPDQSKLTTSLGGDEQPEPELTEWVLSEGRDFVVCSDGFWELFAPAQQQALFKAKDLQAELEQAIARAMDEADDAHDNTSAILVSLPAGAQARARSGVARGSAAALLLVAIGLVVLSWQRQGSPPIPSDTQAQAESGEPASHDGDSPEAPDSGSQDKKRDGPVSRESGEGVEKPLPSAPLPMPSNDKTPAPAGEAGTLELTDLDIPVPAGGEVTEAVEFWLREKGLLGDSGHIGDGRTTVVENGAVIESLPQSHEGLPVDDGLVVAVIRDGRIVTITGRFQPDLDLPDSSWLDWDTALEQYPLAPITP